VAQADGTDVGVWLCTIFIWAATESFRACAELNVAFNTNDCFEIGLQKYELMSLIVVG
jgi:hypothetical protein